MCTVPERYTKPVVLFSMPDLTSKMLSALVKKHNIPNFSDPMECAKAMYGLMQYAAISRRFV